MSDEAAFAELVKSGRLLFMVPRRDVRKWAAYVDREVAARPGATRVTVIRDHLAALDAKSGTMAGIAGLLLAGAAVMGNLLAQGGEPRAPTLALFVTYVIATATSAIYVMSALGIEVPEDAQDRSPAAFEFRLLQRLIYRARNHAWGLRTAQVAGALAFVLAGRLVDSAALFRPG